MAEWKEITKKEFDAPVEPANNYQTLLEMWREEKKKRQEAEGELSIVKATTVYNSPEMRSIQKELNEVKEDNKKLAKQIEDLRVEQGGWKNR